jgi:HAD superfamily hydrolase (TIGR01509 family)
MDPSRLTLVKGLHARKTQIFQDLIASAVVPLRRGVLRLVDETIDAGVRMAVCSTSNEAAVRTLVQTLMGDARYAKFDFFCGDAAPRKKPAPDVYLLAADKLGVSPSRCVVIEDSGIGLQAAKAAGMTCLVTTSTYTGGDDFSAADRVVPELGEPGQAGCVSLDDLEALLGAAAAA